MAETAPLKKSPHVEANTVKKMNGRSLLLSSNMPTLYLKYGRQQVVLWNKTCFLYKNLMLRINRINKRFSQKVQYPEKKLQVIDPPKNQRNKLFQKSSLKSENIYNIAILKKFYT